MADPGANPFESPRPRGVPMLQGVLRVTVALYCFGVAAARLHQGRTDRLIQFLLQPDGGPNSQLVGMSDLVAYGMLVCGVVTLVRPTHVLLMGVTVYAAGAAVAGVFAHDLPWAQWTPALEATRWIAPVALLLLDFWPPRLKATLLLCQSAMTFLRLAAVSTLVAQSLICLDHCQHGGGWNDLILTMMEKGFRHPITTDESQQILGVIGAINLAVAVSLLTSRSRLFLLLATVWGALMSLTPTLAHGQAGYDVTLLRVSEWGAPLALLIFQTCSIRQQDVVYIPEKS